MESNFNEIKQEILRRAKEARAGKFEYSRAYVAENLTELSQVIKDNFYWMCAHSVLTADLIEKYKEDFSTNNIYANQNVKSGYLLCDSSTVEAYNSITVWAYGGSTVKAYGNTTVWACDNTKIKAYDYAKVKAYDNSTVEASGNSTIWASGNAKVEAFDNTIVWAYSSTIILACNNTTVEAYNNATVRAYNNATVKAHNNTKVEAYNNAYCTSCYTIDCKLFDQAIYRVQDTNTVYYADSDIKFLKQ